MDCSRTSVRQGAAEVTLVYRRDMKDMPAANEVHEAIEEGVTAIFQAGPTRVITDKKPARSRASSSSGWRSASPTRPAGAARSPRPGTEFTIPCDRVLLAIGQGPELDLDRARLARRRGDQAPAPQGRRGDVRDRPARRVRDRRRPDRRRDGRPGDRRGPARRLRPRAPKGRYVTVLLGRGDGTLRLRRYFAARVNASRIASGDLNGDGRPDLVFSDGRWP